MTKQTQYSTKPSQFLHSTNMEASTTGKERTIPVHVAASNDDYDDGDKPHGDMAVDNKSKVNSGAAALSSSVSSSKVVDHHPPQLDHGVVVVESSSTTPPKTNATTTTTTTATTTPPPSQRRRGDDVVVVRRNHWPEEHHQHPNKEDENNNIAHHCCCCCCCLLEWIFIEYQKWTYSYMNPILQKGSRQVSQQQQSQQGDGEDNREEGSLLQLDDLYRVPSSMKSDALVTKFE